MNDQTKEIRDAVEGPKISEDVASDLFKKLTDYYDIDPADYGNNKNLKDSFEFISNRLRRAIRKGDIEVIEEDGTPIIYQNLVKPPKGIGKRIRYKELDGNCRAGVKDADNGNMRNQMLVAAMIGEDTATILQFRGKDLSIAEYIASFFMTA